MECVWWWWGGGCLYVKCCLVWYLFKLVVKFYIILKYLIFSLLIEYIYMVEKVKNKNQLCDVVYVKKFVGDI